MAYIISLIFLFILVPFAYFYYEEDEMDSSGTGSARCRQFFRALKYSFLFFLFAGILIVIGIVLNNHSRDHSNDSDSIISRFIGPLDHALAFVIVCLGIFGLVGWITYTAYGLAYLPFAIITREKVAVRNYRTEDLESELLRVSERLEYLELRNRSDQKIDLEIRELRSKKAKLQKDTRDLSQLHHSSNPPSEGFWSNLLSRAKFITCIAFTPLRIAIFLVFTMLSLLISSSFLLNVIDRGLNSSCRLSCGFVLVSPKLIIPLNTALILLGNYFPADYIIFALLVFYIFACTTIALPFIGVRFLCIKLHDMKRRQTMHNAFLMGVWIILFVLIAISLQLTNILPQYITFGTQFFTDSETNEKLSCNLENTKANQCIISIISAFTNGLQLRMPALGTILFFSEGIFVFSFIISLIFSARRYFRSVKQDSPYSEAEQRPLLAENH